MNQSVVIVDNLMECPIIQLNNKSLIFGDIKGNAQFIFLCKPQKPLVNVCLMKILKSTVTKKVIVCLNNLGEEKF